MYRTEYLLPEVRTERLERLRRFRDTTRLATEQRHAPAPELVRCAPKVQVATAR